MKIIGIILKIVAALAAVAGIVYVIATYGDEIVAWAKKLLRICDCDCDCDWDCDECDCEEDCNAYPCHCESQIEEAPIEEVAEEVPAEEAPVEEAVQAEEADFEG